MVTEGNRLSSLKMCVARHNRVGVLLRLVGDNSDKLLDLSANINHLLFEVKLVVKRDLVVAAS